MVFEKEISFYAEGELDLIDLTGKVAKAVRESGIKNGLCCIFCPGSTGAVMTNEFESSLMQDFKGTIRKIVKDKGYRHPSNARSHLRAMLTGSSSTVPVKDGKLQLGTWQQVIFCNFDTRPRKRNVIVKIVGSA